MCTVDPEDMDSSVTIPFSMGSFLGIFEGFSLPAAYLQSIFTGTARSLRYAESDDAETQGFIYRSPSSRAENWALALSWDKSLQVTTGMILGLLPNELDVFLAFMKASRSELLHPMYLPVILCEMQTDLESDNVKRHSLNLFKVELQTRMHTYDYASLLEPSKDLDYDDITRKLNGIISRLSFHQMRLETTLESLKYIEQCERHFRGDERLAESLHARIEQISDEGRALLAEVYCNQRIAQSQLDVVYNLVVQRDNRSNLKMAAASRDIAEAAKEDSSAMRTLAFMSIVFLPATFVASFFSMSMFDWRAAQWSSIASHRLWFYWAVSIPLTLIIMVIWYIWLRRDLDQEHTSRRARHNLATMGFKDISMSMDGTQTSKEHRSWSYPRMRKKKYAQDQEAGHADPHLHTPNSKFKGPNIKPFERVHTGQGPRR
ncbi:hypothetical protein DM02DRAFT_620193 [Periconia macrospinosa]|uniref:Uncharacterized protein n=1 Tax=Periconia macrospinosa TaxID=97972 RepID=A0A2V1D1V4_9PLEO|nr:hypothetical protein DM02DRAFT_620193 [Periconia macrospinosa]